MWWILFGLLIVLPLLTFGVATALAEFVLHQPAVALQFPRASKTLASITVILCPLLFTIWCAILYVFLTAPG